MRFPDLLLNIIIINNINIIIINTMQVEFFSKTHCIYNNKIINYCKQILPNIDSFICAD